MLRVEITRRPDGTGLLRRVRQDGSVTWQKQKRNAAFFALHDLTHFAVESTLGFRCGFYGLIAQGWEIDDTTGKDARGPLPAEAIEVEYLVGGAWTRNAPAQGCGVRKNSIITPSFTPPSPGGPRRAC